MDQKKIGRFIAAMRRHKGLTQRQLAEALNVSNRTVSKWECGDGLPELSNILPLCALLGVTADELLADGAVDTLSFGPVLVENGNVTVGTDEEVRKAMGSNPRTAIGIKEDGTYLFVVADGRTDDSEGLSLYELAGFMKELGAVTYDLNGLLNDGISDFKLLFEREPTLWVETHDRPLSPLYHAMNKALEIRRHHNTRDNAQEDTSEE